MRLRATRISTGIRPIQKGLAVLVNAMFATAAAAGAQMWRYNADDMSSMYLDSAGVADILTFEQPVGFMRDTSREVILTDNRAPRLETANFPGVSGTPSFTYYGDYVEATVGTTGGNSAPGIFTVGKMYRVEFEIYDYVSGTMMLPYEGLGANAKQVSRAGKFSRRIRPLQTGLFLYSINFVGKIRNLRVYEIPFTESVTNSGFTGNLSGWTVTNTGGGTVTWSPSLGGVAQVDSGPTTGDVARIQQAVPTQVGMWYEFNCYIQEWFGSSTNNLLQIGSTDGASDLYTVNIGTNGYVHAFFRATTTTTYVKFYCANDASGVQRGYKLDNVSVVATPGNHRHQPTSTARPVLSARKNFLLYSEQFDNTSGWAKTVAGTGVAPVVTQSFGTAPDGSNTANRVVFNTGAGGTASDLSQLTSTTQSVAVGGTYTSGIWLKSNTGVNQTIRLTDITGVTITVSVTPTWQLFTLTKVATAVSSLPMRFSITGAVAASADILAWGAQFEVGATLGRYQKIASATDYDAAGFPSYLRYDGVDDCLFTPNNVDFSNTDKITVVTGIQKNSDAAVGLPFELGTSSANPGTCYIGAPQTVAANFGAGSGGTTAQSVTASGYAAPKRSIVSMISDISATFLAIRVDGTQVNRVASQGTGNFSNAQMFFGRRNNASLQWNGQEYTSMGFGKLMSPDELNFLETYAGTLTQ